MPGEAAEMMLEGFLCQGCGDIIGDLESGEGLGYPGFCAACEPGGDGALSCEPGETRAERKRRLATTMEPRCCMFCGKKFGSLLGATQHMRDVHHATFIWTRLGGADAMEAAAQRRESNEPSL